MRQFRRLTQSHLQMIETHYRMVLRVIILFLVSLVQGRLDNLLRALVSLTEMRKSRFPTFRFDAAKIIRKIVTYQ